MPIALLRAPETCAEIPGQLARAAREGILFETRHRRRDGTTFPVEVSAAAAEVGRQRLIVSVVRDTTDRKAAEAALREAEERLRQALTAARAGAWEYDLVRRESRWSPEMFDLYGLDRGATAPPPAGFERLVHPEDRARARAELDAAIACGGPFAIEFRARRADDGRELWIASTGAVEHGPDGAPRRARGLDQDITARKEAEAVLARGRQELERLVEARTAALLREMEERRRAEEALRQGEKLQALGQLAAGIAHDFGNVLQVVASGTALLRRPGLDAEKQALVLDGMARAVGNARGLTGRLLAFARRQPLRPETFGLNERLRDMAELLRRTLGSRIRVETELAPDLWPVTADPGQFEVAVLNLAVNARDAMPEGGTLTLTTGHAILDATAERAAGEYVCLTVRDTGTGMPQAVLKRVFEPFFTTKPPGVGTGLGLPQVHGFVKQSGGDIAIESAPGQGTAVTLLLPRAPATPNLAPAAATAPPQMEAPAGVAVSRAAGRTVLVVEDNAEVAHFATTLLEGMGYAARIAASAAEALALLEAGEPVDVVFSDVVMPGGMDGVELATVLRRRWPKLGIVLATGYSETLLARPAEAPVEVLSKPYRLDDLAAALERALVAAGTGQPDTGQGRGEW